MSDARKHWTSDFDFYEARLHGDRAMITLDLGARSAAPVETHPERLQIRIGMLRPREDGLRASDEADALFALEDQIVGRVSVALDALFVGRIVCAGKTDLIFHVPTGVGARVDRGGLRAIVGDTAPYGVTWLTAEDPNWGMYLEFLWPNPYVHQAILNRRLVRARAEHGDCERIARQVDHVVSFCEEDCALRGADALVRAGFKVDPIKQTKGDAPTWSVEFHRHERLDEGRPHAFTDEILDIVLPLDGEYDGWGAVVVKEGDH